MIHAGIHRRAVGILAIAVAIAMTLALSATTGRASARTFSYPTGGSLVQQSLPPHWACDMSRALGQRTSACRGSGR
jgi:hypothetical protein